MGSNYIKQESIQEVKKVIVLLPFEKVVVYPYCLLEFLNFQTVFSRRELTMMGQPVVV